MGANRSSLVVHVAGAKATAAAEENMRQKEPEDLVDGCGFHGDGDEARPVWVPFSSADHGTFSSILQCLQESKLFPVHFGQSEEFRYHLQRHPPNLKRLLCHQEVTPAIAREALSRFRRVAFIGDSVLIQQYTSLLCLADPHIFRQPENNRTLGGDELQYHMNTNQTQTAFSMERFGEKFWTEQQKNWSLWKNPAWNTYGPEDLIVINAGLHFELEEATKLRDIASFVGSKSSSTNATVLFVESNDQQFPTSNGVYTEACKLACQCEPLTQLRLQGKEIPYDNGRNHVNLTQVPSNYNIPSLVAALYSPKHRLLTLEQDGIRCVPDCAPPNWRNDLVRSVLQESPTHIVPAWEQLVAHGKEHAKRFGDCTHLTVEAALMMNQQLIRTLLHGHAQAGMSSG